MGEGKPFCRATEALGHALEAPIGCGSELHLDPAGMGMARLLVRVSGGVTSGFRHRRMLRLRAGLTLALAEPQPRPYPCPPSATLLYTQHPLMSPVYIKNLVLPLSFRQRSRPWRCPRLYPSLSLQNGWSQPQP